MFAKHFQRPQLQHFKFARSYKPVPPKAIKPPLSQVDQKHLNILQQQADLHVRYEHLLPGTKEIPEEIKIVEQC